MNQIDDTLAFVSLKRTILHTYTLPDDVRKAGPEASPLAGDWLIGLINLSSYCMTIAATRRIGGGDAEWKWTPIPQVCRNCTTSYSQCFNEKRWAIIMSTPCQSAPFEMFIGRAVSDTDVQGAIFDIRPNCGSSGGILGITD